MAKHRPRLLSDNGPGSISSERKDYRGKQKIEHTRGAPYHPMTPDKIERYPRSMMNVVKLEHYYPESLNHITPADLYFGHYPAIMDRRAIIKYETLQRRRKENPRHCVNQ